MTLTQERRLLKLANFLRERDFFGVYNPSWVKLFEPALRTPKQEAKIIERYVSEQEGKENQ